MSFAFWSLLDAVEIKEQLKKAEVLGWKQKKKDKKTQALKTG